MRACVRVYVSLQFCVFFCCSSMFLFLFSVLIHSINFLVLLKISIYFRFRGHFIGSKKYFAHEHKKKNIFTKQFATMYDETSKEKNQLQTHTHKSDVYVIAIFICLFFICFVFRLYAFSFYSYCYFASASVLVAVDQSKYSTSFIVIHFVRLIV